MKTILLSLCLVLFSGCSMYRINVNEQHSKVLGKWRLKTDAYIINYNDEPSRRYAVACVPINANNLPDWDVSYNEHRFGSIGNGVKIIGGLRKGTIIKIDRVIENHHANMGVRYEPSAQILDMHGELQRINFSWYYSGFSESMELNPEWAERIK